MKNIFKVMSFVLVASSLLFVSCKKDKEAVYSANVTFGGAAWTSVEGIDVTVNGDDVRVLLSEKAGQYPQFLLQMNGKAKKSYTVVMNTHTVTAEEANEEWDEGDVQLMGFNDDNIKALKYFSHKYVEDGVAEGDYWPLNATIEVSAFDADDAEISCTVAANMFNYEDWFYTDLSKEQLTQFAATITTEMVDVEE